MVPEIQYYEVHLTLEPVFDKKLEQMEKLCSKFGFKMAKLLMQKNRNVTALRSNKDSFCTGRFETFADAYKQGTSLEDSMRKNGFKVWRFKIEAILHDKKYER